MYVVYERGVSPPFHTWYKSPLCTWCKSPICTWCMYVGYVRGVFVFCCCCKCFRVKVRYLSLNTNFRTQMFTKDYLRNRPPGMGTAVPCTDTELNLSFKKEPLPLNSDSLFMAFKRGNPSRKTGGSHQDSLTGETDQTTTFQRTSTNTANWP
jgi:hypothetical protein